MKAKKLLGLILALTVVPVMSQAQTNALPTSGNVGIGTANPQCALEVKGEAVIDGKMQVDSSVTLRDNLKVLGNLRLKDMQDANAEPFRFLYVNPNGKVKKGNFDDLEIREAMYRPRGCNPLTVTPTWSSDTSILFVDCPVDARVGIGTSTPDFKLQVAGETNTTGLQIGNTTPSLLQTKNTRAYIQSTNATGLHLMANWQSDYGHGIIVEADRELTKAITVRNSLYGSNGEEVFRVYGSGLVEAKKVVVSHTIWADYVFEDEYNLLPLDELEEYIEENGHLPNVPTTAEVQANGMELGEMDVLLLEKVEELTLYMLQMEKKVQVLQEENAQLQVEVKRLNQ